jgi:FkbM family methyltransferase
MNLSGISDKSLVGRILRFPLRFIPPQMVLPVMQGRLKGKKWIIGSSNHGCWLGSYEYAKRILFEETVTEGSVVFDVGAHAGFYTLLASVLVGPTGRVFAFEPLPGNLSYLKQHLRLNNVENTTVIEAAVLDKSGVTSFDEGPSSSMGHVSSHGKLQVKAVAIDELVASGELPLPGYVKMDIEGAETLALAGAKSTLEKAHATVFLATHGTDIQRECRCFLESLGYQLQPLDGVNVEQSSELFATYREAGQQRVAADVTPLRFATRLNPTVRLSTQSKE